MMAICICRYYSRNLSQKPSKIIPNLGRTLNFATTSFPETLSKLPHEIKKTQFHEAVLGFFGAKSSELRYSFELEAV